MMDSPSVCETPILPRRTTFWQALRQVDDWPAAPPSGRTENCCWSNEARAIRLEIPAGGIIRSIRTRESIHAGNSANLRELRSSFVTQFSRSEDLFLRVHILSNMRGRNTRQRMPELRRRIQRTADSPCTPMERPEFSDCSPRLGRNSLKTNRPRVTQGVCRADKVHSP